MITEPCMGKKNIFLMGNGKRNVHIKTRSIRIKVAMTKGKAEDMTKGKAEGMVKGTAKDINTSRIMRALVLTTHMLNKSVCYWLRINVKQTIPQQTGGTG